MDKSSSPFLVGSSAGRSPQLETLLSMLASSRAFLLAASRELTAAELDAKPVAGHNSAGALLAHLAAAELMMRNLTCHGRTFGEGEEDFSAAFRFERNPLAGQPVDAYHDHLQAVRDETFARLSERDDDWLAVPRSFFGRPSNNHYYWTHYLMDEARHTGQLILLRKYLLPVADDTFNPYALA